MLFILTVTVLTALAAGAQMCTEPACAAGGSDYFQTTAASVTLPGGQGFGTAPIALTSLPNFSNPSGGNVDTIVQRQEDAPINGADVPSQILDLSLIATGQTNQNGFHYNIYVTLDPANLPLNVGMIGISGVATQGTFTTCTSVYLQVSFMPTDGGPPIAPFMPGGACALGNTPPCTTGTTPYSWSSTPPAGSFLLPAGYPAFNANQHTLDTLPPNYGDFYLTSTGNEPESCSVGGLTFVQMVQQAPMSTPPTSKPTQHNGGSELKARK